MYVNKVVFAERDDFAQEEFEVLESRNVVCVTDYGTTEITSSRVQEAIEEDDKEVLEILKYGLGVDVFDGLAKDELDFVLVVY